MKKKFIIFIGIVSVVAIGAISFHNNISSKPIVESHASWVKYYPDVRSLIEDADVIVEGEAQSLNTFPHYDESNISTEVTFKVNKWYKGSDIKAREQITILQDGGIYKGVNYKLDKVEIMEPGKKYLLFLDYAPDADLYAVLTGWQGQFKLGLTKAENPEQSRSMDIDKLEKEITDSHR